MKPIVLVGTNSFWSMREEVDALELWNRFELIFDKDFEISDDRAEDVQALVVGDRPIGVNIINRFPNLKTIARAGTGYDNVDIKAAKERDIVVTRVIKLNADAVSEFTLGLILSLLRRIPQLHHGMINNEWQRQQGILLSEATVGIIGLGEIGCSLAQKLNALGTQRVFGWNRTDRPEIDRIIASYGLEIVDIPSIMSESDVVVVAIALAPNTNQLIDSGMLSLMKKAGILINVSRGAVVDEVALVDLLSKGLLGGVALDVFSTEPPYDDLFRKPFFNKLSGEAKSGHNVILTPHNASMTAGNAREVALQVGRNISLVIDGHLECVEIVEYRDD
ncbi:MAG: NAD(P)-dependent oxidoreductase [bacterium]|nr:NAD(P)-dependent oxidoreductase [bacterium]